MRAIEVNGLSKRFAGGVPALSNIDLCIDEGEMVALIGASGSGKSTLLRHISGLIAADADGKSSITVFGRTMQSNGRVVRGARELRCTIGVIFQQFNLVPRLRVLTNVLIGHLGTMSRWRGLLGQFSMEQKQSAIRALQRVGIADHALKRGCDLSGGQQQRAAIARALHAAGAGPQARSS